MIIFDGVAAAAKLEQGLRQRVAQWVGQGGKPPAIGAILFREDAGSRLYTQLKREAAARVGIAYLIHEFSLVDDPHTVGQQISHLNENPEITGIIVQKPWRKTWLAARASGFTVAGKSNIGQDAVGRSEAGRGEVERDEAERSGVEHDTVERDAAERDAVEQSMVDRGAVQRREVDRSEVGRSEVERGDGKNSGVEPGLADQGWVVPAAAERSEVEHDTVEQNAALDYQSWWQQIMGAVAPDKDVDGLHPVTIAAIKQGTWQTEGRVLPATCRAVLLALEEAQQKLGLTDQWGKTIILGRTDLLGVPLFAVLQQQGIESELIGVRELAERKHSGQLLADASVLVSATGQPHLITGELVRDGVVLIDVGEPRPDIDRASVAAKARFLTPVPGGIGPLTVMLLLDNALQLAQRL